MSKFRELYEKRLGIRAKYAMLRRTRNYRIAMLIEHYVNHPDIPLKSLGPLYGFSYVNASHLLSKHYFNRVEIPMIIVRHSKLNNPNYRGEVA